MEKFYGVVGSITIVVLSVMLTFSIAENRMGSKLREENNALKIRIQEEVDLSSSAIQSFNALYPDRPFDLEDVLEDTYNEGVEFCRKNLL